EKALSAFKFRSQAEGVDLAAEIAIALDAINSAHGAIGPREQARRAGLVLLSTPLKLGDLATLAGIATRYEAPVKNAIVRHIPPSLKRVAFGKVGDANHQASQKEHLESSKAEIQQATDGILRGMVLLVGTFQEHEANHRFLDRNGFQFVR